MAYKYICPQCGYMGNGKMKTRGSFFIEVILWLCLLAPGLIYSIWRQTTKYRTCFSCGSSEVMPATSPRGKRLVKEYGHE